MTKDKISDYSQSPASNDDLGEGGTAVDCYIDRGLKTVMAHLAQVNGGAASLDDTLTLADSDDPSKQFGFDGSDVTPSSKVVLKIPDSSGTIATRETISRDLDNKIINGDFVIWQRGLSQTTSGYSSDDRWHNAHAGSSKTHSQQTFVLGQTDVPGNPKYYCRTAVTSVAGNGNYVIKMQSIEGVDTLAGKTATVTFWAKADGSKNIAFELRQRFGTGGSPSPDVNAIGVTTCALTTSWKKFSFMVNIPSMAGKMLGTNGNDNLLLVLWFEAGSDFNSKANNLGQQSGIFDIAKVSLLEGDETVANDPSPSRKIDQELAYCQRYYFEGFLPLRGVAIGTGGSRLGALLPTQMRSIPAVSVIGNIYDASVAAPITAITANYSTPCSTEIDVVCASALSPGNAVVLYYPSTFIADAEL